MQFFYLSQDRPLLPFLRFYYHNSR